MSDLVNAQKGFRFDPNAHYLFGRSYALSIGAPNQKPVPGKTNGFQYGTLGSNPAPLRVKFDIEKTPYGASANHSKIEIYNLSIQSRSAIKKGYLVNLQAGYKGLVDVIFTGNVFLSKSERKGPDIITTLECLDGGNSIVYARLDKSYPAKTTMVQILQDVATAMNTGTDWNQAPTGYGTILGLTQVVYNKGFTAHGPCQKTLDKLLKPQGLQWSIQNNNLTIVPKKNYNGNEAVVVSVDTGMIGVPSLAQYYTQFTSLLNPKIKPNSLVQLISQENPILNGFYKVVNAKYEGDSHENKWQVACECMPMPNIVQKLPASEGSNLNTAVIG